MEIKLLSTWSFGLRGHARAWPDLHAGGSALDAAETVCRTVEADPEVDSVGFGGLPDAEGAMSLDGAVMLGPDRCGAVASITRHLHAVSIARLVMERTSHVLLAGDGADRFAEAQGVEPAAALLSDEARSAWERWRRAPHPVDQSRDRGYAPTTSPPAPRPVDSGGGRLFGAGHDTVAVLARDRDGIVAGAATTSGVPYKVPGRVGDCPIIGHGLYVHPDRGAAVATGSGELIMRQCAAFLTVELMTRGAAPLDAMRETLERIAADHEIRPEHQVALIAMDPGGAWASAALRPGYRTSVTTRDRDEVVEPDGVLLEDAVDDPYGQMT